jgi:hypothetical protein
MAGQRRLGWLLCQEVHHLEGRTHRPAVMVLVVCN